MLARKLVSTSAINLVDYAIRFAGVLLVSPFMVRSLGEESYGFWVFLLSLIGYLNLLDLGLANTAVRYLSRALAGKDDGKFVAHFEYFRSLYHRVGWIALATTGIGWLLIPLFSRDVALVAEARFVIGLGGCLVGATFFLRIHSALLKSHVLYHRIVVAGLVRFVIFTAGIFIVLSRSPDVRSLALLWIATALLEQAIIVLLARPFLPRVSPHGSAPALPGEDRREIRNFAGKHFVNVVSKLFRSQVDVQISGALVSLSSVTYYSIGSRFLLMFQDLMNAVFGTHFLAVFSRSDDDSNSKDQLSRSLRISSAMAWTGGVCLLLLGPPFIDQWMGTGFEASHEVVRWLAIPYTLMLMQYPVGPWVAARNRHGRFAAVTIGSGVFNLVASIILTLYLGFIGVVIATAIEVTLVALLAWPWLLSRHSGYPYQSWFKSLMVPAMRLSPSYLIATLLVAWFPPDSWSTLVALGFGIFLLFALNAWLGVLNREERKLMFRLITK